MRIVILLILCFCSSVWGQSKELDVYFNMPVGLEKKWRWDTETVIANFCQKNQRIVILSSKANGWETVLVVGQKTVRATRTFDGRLLVDYGVIFKLPVEKHHRWRSLGIGKGANYTMQKKTGSAVIGKKWLKTVRITTGFATYHYAKGLGLVRWSHATVLNVKRPK